jgi:hypothetical protein
MALGTSKNIATNHISNIPSATKEVFTAVVYDVILDENHEYAKKTGANSAYIGAIKFRKRTDLHTEDGNLPIAFPIDRNLKSLPVRNELVNVIENGNGSYSYRRISADNNPSRSGEPDIISKVFVGIKEQQNHSKNYHKVSTTNISRTNKDGGRTYDGFGKYYNITQNLHNLKLYEGDTLIESRFGQSIRLSGYNNPKNIFAPTLIIRNRESSLSNTLPTNSVEEDINRDGSTLIMSSGEHELGFVPGTVDDKGKGDFQAKPDTFLDYPDKLKGDQLLLSSGRIILSSRNAEMIFYSKKNYGFISDGGMSIDNKGGLDITVNDDINIDTNGNNINFKTGVNGTLFLGTGGSTPLEPMVKGQQLVDVLSDLIDAIGNMTFFTPSGATQVGPTNAADFGTIKAALNNILSNTIQIS